MILHFNFLIVLQCCAGMETLDLSMEQLSMRVVWRFAGMKPGALCVMDCGQDLMHKWPADSLVMCQMVQDTYNIITDCMFVQNLN